MGWLKEKGGLKKYIFNWAILLGLLVFIADYCIQPHTFLSKLPFAVAGFIVLGALAFLLLFYVEIEKKKRL